MASFLSGASDWWNGGGKNFAANALNDLGFGLTQSTTGLGGALGAATAYSEQQQPARDLQAEKIAAQKQQALQLQTAIANLRDKYQRPDLADAVSQGYDVNKAWDAVLQKAKPADLPSSVQEYQFYADQEKAAGRAPKSFSDYQAGTRPGIKGSLGATLPFMDPQTQQLHPIQMFSDGSRMDMVTGAAPDPGLVYAPYDLAGARAGGAADANTAAAARGSLPGAEQAYAITKKAIDQLSNDASVQAGQGENFGNVLGVPQQMLPILPKTNRANFQNVIDQLSGQAFLNIRQALKGAGQVTDFEGAKGEDAISRMKNAASRGDEAAFKQAVADFNTALDNGMALLRKQAQGAYAAGNVPGLGSAPQQGGSGDPDLDRALQQYGN
jgi:hypothetical protein